MQANETPQVGGDHYRRGSFQHWDLVNVLSLDYLSGCATKYVTRWRYKGTPVLDLKKALQYHNKFMDSPFNAPRRLRPPDIMLPEINRFCAANNLGDLEREYITAVATWEDRASLELAREYLLLLMDEAEALEAIPEAKPVPLTEENHYSERVEE